MTEEICNECNRPLPIKCEKHLRIDKNIEWAKELVDQTRQQERNKQECCICGKYEECNQVEIGGGVHFKCCSRKCLTKLFDWEMESGQEECNWILREIEIIISGSKKTIQSLWDTMEAVSKGVVIGKNELTHGEKGNITLHKYECVTEHDEQHVSQICERKRFIIELEDLKSKLKEGA